MNKKIDKQVEYLDRWVSRDNFRAFIYKADEQKLVESYEEFQKALESGLWFDSRNKIPKEIRQIQEVSELVVADQLSRKIKHGRTER